MPWWITTTSPEGKFVILGSYNTEEEALNYAWSHIGTNFETEQLNTKDMSKATRILKKKRYDTIRDLDVALQRAKHKVKEGE